CRCVGARAADHVAPRQSVALKSPWAATAVELRSPPYGGLFLFAPAARARLGARVCACHTLVVLRNVTS
ncbi:hypothetical protein, partial [Pseudomonas sp. 71_D]|uniref:hypothetical protein n=1 Tax=Pseudomonas sp. 71_D TaxID=2813564 RepID=UPI001A9FBF23